MSNGSICLLMIAGIVLGACHARMGPSAIGGGISLLTVDTSSLKDIQFSGYHLAVKPTSASGDNGPCSIPIDVTKERGEESEISVINGCSYEIVFEIGELSSDKGRLQNRAYTNLDQNNKGVVVPKSDLKGGRIPVTLELHKVGEGPGPEKVEIAGLTSLNVSILIPNQQNQIDAKNPSDEDFWRNILQRYKLRDDERFVQIKRYIEGLKHVQIGTLKYYLTFPQAVMFAHTVSGVHVNGAPFEFEFGFHCYTQPPPTADDKLRLEGAVPSQNGKPAYFRASGRPHTLRSTTFHELVIDIADCRYERAP